jgi:hypothetical protein
MILLLAAFLFTGVVGLLDPSPVRLVTSIQCLPDRERRGQRWYTFSDLGQACLTLSLVIPFAFWEWSVLHPPILHSRIGSLSLYPSCLAHVVVVLHSQGINNILLVTEVCVSNSTASSANHTTQGTPPPFDLLPLMTPDLPFKILQIIVPLQLPALALLPPQSKIGVSPLNPSFPHWGAANAIFL